MNTKTNIEWCDATWNPVVGCKRGCPYCYAKRKNDQFHFIPDWTEPKFYPERLKEPARLRKSSKIFVGSMCDLWAPWIPNHWIVKILNVISDNRRHTFQFLTKYPQRYGEWNFRLDNIEIGTTVTNADDIWRIEELKKHHPRYFRFVSWEPCLGAIPAEIFNDGGIDLLIIGAQTGRNANKFKPKAEWLKDFPEGKRILWKNNLKKALGEK